MITIPGKAKGDVWFVYDGDCPICSTAARVWRIREAVGNLYLVNARAESDHPVMHEIKAKGFNIDEGMVIKFQDTYYHGANALHIMALLGTDQGWFNRMNVWLFRSKVLSAICYPPMRAMRNVVLRLKGVPQLRNLEQP